MTPAQCRAARALLDMTQSDLARAAGLGLSTVVDFEKGRRHVSQRAVQSIQKAFESAGIPFNEQGDLRIPEIPSSLAGFAEPPRIFGKITHVGKKIERPRSLSSAQIRAARALLKWSAADLARASALGVNTIRRAEAAEGLPSLTAANQLAIRSAFRSAGVVFIDENGGGRGVRLRTKLKSRPGK
jgi:transcriptional regulator with XRE-family HTH domain